MSFIKEFICHPQSTGAIAPSSRFLARKMLEDIDFQNCDCIVEYGPGTGVFTQRLVAAKRPETLLLVLERNANFCCDLQQRLGQNENVHIINDGAERVQKYLGDYGRSKADVIVSGLPFTVLPAQVSAAILAATCQVLGQDGSLVTFQYSLVKMKLLEGYFSQIRIKHTLRNLPPAYVLTCRV